MKYDKNKMIQLQSQGETYDNIAKKMGCSNGRLITNSIQKEKNVKLNMTNKNKKQILFILSENVFCQLETRFHLH